MKKLLFLPLLLPLAGCPTLQKAADPVAPIDAKAVTPLWNLVITRHDNLIDIGVENGTVSQQESNIWKTDTELLKAILDKALNKDEQ